MCTYWKNQVSTYRVPGFGRDLGDTKLVQHDLYPQRTHAHAFINEEVQTLYNHYGKIVINIFKLNCVIKLL